LQLIGNLGGGVDTSYADDAKVWARLKTIAGILFDTPNYSDGGSLYWDGTGTGDNVADHETRVTAIEAWDTDDLPNASGVSGTTTTNALDKLATLIGDLQGTAIGVPSLTGVSSDNDYTALPAEAEADYVLGVSDNSPDGTYQVQDLRRLVGMIVQEMTKQVQVTGQTQGLVVRKNGTAVDDNQDHGIAFKRSDDTLEHSVFRDEASGAPGLHLVNHIATGGALEFQVRDTGDIAINSKARGAVTFFDESLGDKGAIAPTTVRGSHTYTGTATFANTYQKIGEVSVTKGKWALKAYFAALNVEAAAGGAISWAEDAAVVEITTAAIGKSTGYFWNAAGAAKNCSCVATAIVDVAVSTDFDVIGQFSNTVDTFNQLVTTAERVA
jgi:hypothetical protein